MDRKKIIIQEIKYWKKSRLLPEQYCNFLLSLYSEGEETGYKKAEQEKNKIKLLSLMMTILAVALFGLTFLVIYFTDFSPFLQTGLVIFFSAILFLMAAQSKRFNNQMIVHLYILLGMLILFFATIHSIGFLFPNSKIAITGAVIISCLVWLLIGKKYNLKYLMISGGLGFVIIIYFLLK